MHTYSSIINMTGEEKKKEKKTKTIEVRSYKSRQDIHFKLIYFNSNTDKHSIFFIFDCFTDNNIMFYQ